MESEQRRSAPIDPRVSADHVRMALPTVDGKIATVELPLAMSERAWTQFIAWLEVVKPSLVTGENAQRT